MHRPVSSIVAVGAVYWRSTLYVGRADGACTRLQADASMLGWRAGPVRQKRQGSGIDRAHAAPPVGAALPQAARALCASCPGSMRGNLPATLTQLRTHCAEPRGQLSFNASSRRVPADPCFGWLHRCRCVSEF